MNTQCINNPEIEGLIAQVFEFQFKVNSTTICFDSIRDNVELVISEEKKKHKEQMDIDTLKRECEEIEKTLSETINERRRVDEKIDINQDNNDLLRLFRELTHKKELLENKISSINRIINNNGWDEYPLLGEFIAPDRMHERLYERHEGHEREENLERVEPTPKPKVVLYIKNIRVAAKKNSCTEAMVMVNTFIHEMFHAWDYFASGMKRRTILQIDEPMVEFSTLYFLKKLASENARFEPTKQYAEKSVDKKRNCVGNLAAYGFGYYLYSLLITPIKKHAETMLEKYGAKSGEIWTEETFHFDDEQTVFKSFYRTIVREIIPDEVLIYFQNNKAEEITEL